MTFAVTNELVPPIPPISCRFVGAAFCEITFQIIDKPLAKGVGSRLVEHRQVLKLNALIYPRTGIRTTADRPAKIHFPVEAVADHLFVLCSSSSNWLIKLGSLGDPICFRCSSAGSCAKTIQCDTTAATSQTCCHRNVLRPHEGGPTNSVLLST